MASILFVENDALFGEMYARSLTRAGHHVRLVTDSPTALDELEKELPDLMLFDILLPGPNGLWLLKELRRRKSWRDMPVMIITNLAEAELAMPGKLRDKLGIVRYLLKTKTTPQEVTAVVGEALDYA